MKGKDLWGGDLPLLELAFLDCSGGEPMGQIVGNSFGSLTIGVFLKVRELFRREFTLCLAHFSGGGGCRAQRPFHCTAQSQYTPVQSHFTPCDTPAQRDRGQFRGRLDDW